LLPPFFDDGRPNPPLTTVAGYYIKNHRFFPLFLFFPQKSSKLRPLAPKELEGRAECRSFFFFFFFLPLYAGPIKNTAERSGGEQPELPFSKQKIPLPLIFIEAPIEFFFFGPSFFQRPKNQILCQKKRLPSSSFLVHPEN